MKNPAYFWVLAVALLSRGLPFWAQQYSKETNATCPVNFPCRNMSLTFPFADLRHYNCGLCTVDCGSSESFPKVALNYISEQWLIAKAIGSSTMSLHDEYFQTLLSNESCSAFSYASNFLHFPSISFTFPNNITLLKCLNNSDSSQRLKKDSFPGYGYYGGCSDIIYYSKTPNSSIPDPKSIPMCSVFNLPYNKSFISGQGNQSDVEVFRLLSSDYDLQWHVFKDCEKCHDSGGFCRTDWSKPRCVNADGNSFCPTDWSKPHCVNADSKDCEECHDRKKKLPLILGLVGAALVALVLSALAVFLICRRKGIKGPYFLSRNYSKQSSKLDFEEGSVYLGVSVFTYSELREATKNFDASKELGDGGFGTVYHGKLQDGREVAVKRLYEHNFKRLEQFMNEIEILTRLRHPNLVALYGCSSRRSRELLLVYEYIPNGTIADHLHGDRADHKYLTWAHRMSIAIETADALSYLHASDIIHRDVKTTNILLDHNFCVKVADFGLSRLFPLDVTHVSTAPQGTPGYVDPEYHQCYHLTDRSDVYSFGVVLVELISSMPAVDMSRHRHEINLANLAINRIQRCAFDELIDPSLGYKTNAEVMRMTTSVAELAFQCLQGEKEMRPSMGEVLRTLKDIRNFKATSVEIVQNVDDVKDKVNVFSPESEDRVLLKNTKFPSSPVSVTHLWVSSSTSASTSSN